MKTAFVLAAIACLTAATGIPECAIGYLQDGLPQLGCSGIEDLACLCKPSTQSELVSVVGPCMMKKCSTDEIMQAQSEAGSACAAYSAHPNTPPKATSAAPPPPPKSTAAAPPPAYTSSANNNYAPPSAPASSAAPSSAYNAGGEGLSTAPASSTIATNYAVPTPSASNSTGAGSYTTPISYVSAGSAAAPAAVGLLAIFAAALAL